MWYSRVPLFQVREVSMKKLAISLSAALIVLGTSGTADAQWHRGGWGGGGGWHGGWGGGWRGGYYGGWNNYGCCGGGALAFGLIGGALLGSAIAASSYPYYDYGYGYPAYGYGYPAYTTAYYGYPYYPRSGYGYGYRRAYYAPRYYGGYGGYYRGGWGRGYYRPRVAHYGGRGFYGGRVYYGARRGRFY